MRQLDFPNIPFHALLARAAENWPQGTAISFKGQDLTFSDWNRQASRLANGLLSLGLRPSDRVGLFTPNCPQYEVGFFGIGRMGGVPTPLNPAYKEREVRYQLDDSGAAAVIVHESLYPILDGVAGDRRVIVIGDTTPEGTTRFSDLLAHQPDSMPDVALGLEDLVSLPYSSGTTGLSKGVMLTQRNMVCNAFQFADATQTTDADTMLIFLPLYHIYGVILMASAVVCGARHILMERFDLAEMVGFIERERVTELFVVPPVMLALANAPDLRPGQLASLRIVMSAAAPLAPDVGRRVAERLELPVIQAYGMTEASPLTHMVPLTEYGFDNVGMAVAGTDCRIVDLDTGARDLPPGKRGEVIIRGPQVMAGYWNAPEETSYAIRDGWLHTGDVGKVDEAGRLQIVDRKKEMIKYKAFSIAPAELEAVLLEHPAVLDCGVTGHPDDEAGEVPRAYVVLRSGAQATPEELMVFVAERVAGYKQIRLVDIVESIPRTPSGKILRRMLKGAATAT